jgi:tRNA/rRNA methyltransferase
MKLSNISIVLVKPKGSGNVGSVARAMKNTGLKQLVLIDPCDFKNLEAKKMAVGDTSILGKAKVYSDLKDALGSYQFTVATTRRMRRRFNQFLSPREIAERIAALPNHFKIALVFGAEDKGLENAEIAHCQFVSTIPSHPKLPSLNLAQAVMIYAYEIYCRGLETIKTEKQDMASVQELEAMYEHFERTLRLIKFFNRGKSETLMESIRNFLGRAKLSSRDIRILRGIFSTIRLRLQKGHKS